MDNITASICVNGELKPGDLVISTPADDFACLVGTVLSINKLGTPEHAAETGNDTDAIHVDFMDSEYSERRIAEIEEMFSELFQAPRLFEECPIDDALMSPDILIRITGIGDDTLKAILDSREAAEALCKLVEIGPSAVHDAQTPAQAALSEPDIYDDEATAALREQLINRLNGNLADYFNSLHGMDGKEIASFSSEIAVTTDAHYYLTEIHNFHTSELEYLLQFQNPLQVVADAFDAAGVYDRSDIMWKIFDQQDALQGDYPLIEDETPGALASEKEAAVTRDGLFERIAKKHCRFETLETRNRDSLDFREVSVWGFKSALEEAFAAGQAHQKAQTKGMGKTSVDTEKSQPGRDTGEKSSVLAQIREAAKAPREPRRDNPARDKSGPEL